MLLLGCLAAVPARADSINDAEIRCQLAYDSRSDLGIACQRGVKLAAGTERVQEAVAGCTKDFEDTKKVDACKRGIALHRRLAHQVRDDEQSTFTYTWRASRAPVQLEVGDYQLLLGDAEKSIDDCMRAYEGSSTPPSCLSGITLQHKPPR
jgi:hypothetical protein